MSQLILIKKDFPDTNLVILGGKEAPYVSIYIALQPHGSYRLERTKC